MTRQIYRRRTIVEIVITNCIGANPHSEKQTIMLSKFRSGKSIRPKWLIDQIEQYIEHEYLHILLFNLLDTETCIRFDLIEYPTFVIWKKRIPQGYLFKDRNTPTGKWNRWWRRIKIKTNMEKILKLLKKKKEEFE